MLKSKPCQRSITATEEKGRQFNWCFRLPVHDWSSLTKAQHFNTLARRKAPAERQKPEGEGANLDRHLVPYHGKQSESNLASSLSPRPAPSVGRGPKSRGRGC